MSFSRRLVLLFSCSAGCRQTPIRLPRICWISSARVFGLQRVERAEDLLDGVQPVDLGRAVAGRERLGQQLLVDLADRQLAQLLDPFAQLDQVSLLLGAGQRNTLGPIVKPVDVEEPAAAQLLRVGVVVLGPDPDELLRQLLGLAGVGASRAARCRETPRPPR